MGGRVEAIARELPEQVKRLETAADKKVVDAAADRWYTRRSALVRTAPCRCYVLEKRIQHLAA